MRVLFLTHAFNSLTQRLYVELAARGHEISIEFDINDAVTVEAVNSFAPDVIVAPYLRRAIPAEIWQNHLCLIVHPGVEGDRGPSSVDWAITEDADTWGVTVLQADQEMDAGDIWASRRFAMRAASKGSLYRNEITEAAVGAVVEALDRVASHRFAPKPQADLGGWRPLMKQVDRAIDWAVHDTATIVRRINAADGFPGLRDTIGGREFYMFDAHRDDQLRGEPGALIARRNGAICRATVDGAVWITHLKAVPGETPTFKLPAQMALGDAIDDVPVAADHDGESWRDIWYERDGDVGVVHFPFYNGAMSTTQCERLTRAVVEARAQDTRVLVLAGGPDFFSNGIHLNTIEAAHSPAEESWANINAMDDLCLAILTTQNQLTLSAMAGNAGAGGVFLALCADGVLARQGVVLNPHYKNMGNLYGSEYWSYVLPRRAGTHGAQIMANRLPIGPEAARQMGLVDTVIAATPAGFLAAVNRHAHDLAGAADYAQRLATKQRQRIADEASKPLAQYREKELARMRLNFFGFDPSYHVARYNFVFRVPHSRTPLHLAVHR